MVMPKILKMMLPARGERDERDRAGPRPSAREHAPLLRRVAHRHSPGNVGMTANGSTMNRIDVKIRTSSIARLGHRTARSSPMRMRRIFAVGACRSRSWARTRLYVLRRSES